MSNADQGLPVGYYKVRAVEGSEQFGRSLTGGIQVAIDLEVADGDFAGERVTTVLAFADKAREVSIERLIACGWNYEYTPAGNHIGIASNVVSMESKIDSWRKPDGSAQETKRYEIKTGGRFKFKEALAPAEVRDFQKEMQSYAKQMASGGARNSSSGAAGGGGYAKDWDGKDAGAGGNRPKVDL